MHNGFEVDDDNDPPPENEKYLPLLSLSGLEAASHNHSLEQPPQLLPDQHVHLFGLGKQHIRSQEDQ